MRPPHNLLRRLLLPVLLCCALLTGCGVAAPDVPLDQPGREPVTITVWSAYSGRELDVFNKVLQRFEQEHPWITVRSVGSQNNDRMVAALRGGPAPDVQWAPQSDLAGVYCPSGGWRDLSHYIERDGLDPGVFVPAAWKATSAGGKRCALPVLGDIYGLYYNKKKLAEAGFTEPPRTMSQLDAYARKLTRRDGQGDIRVAGYAPLTLFYANRPTYEAQLWGAEWFDKDGGSAVAADPDWRRLLAWRKKLIDWYGYDKLRAFTAGAGAQYSASNAFQTGQLAMMLDGEFRTAFVENEAKDLDYGTAPFPAPDDRPQQYGAGAWTVHLAGVTHRSAHPDAAWRLVRWLATSPRAQVALAEGLHNVPTTKAALRSPKLAAIPHFKPFLDMAADPHSKVPPSTPAGVSYQDSMAAFFQQWESGEVQDADKGLAEQARTIDSFLDQVTIGMER
ncbi:extracellular solute-binding protein [Streptomyces tubbatahanensis]|uniref:Extracellular solute-binding protein n=1 Tax=Streptomyces tubbatahanensis TaxID=2923272 RepID=A0ABY3Y1N6_9ACTN|nr:extracellular solute-binding protein [Streptomyces tubbatahanensis]UNT00756.1 extracellular solute-binding protein [Streptomyces tubbatahanensis]